MNNLIPFETKNMNWYSPGRNLPASKNALASTQQQLLKPGTNALSGMYGGGNSQATGGTAGTNNGAPDVSQMSMADQMAAIGQLDVMEDMAPSIIGPTMTATKHAMQMNVNDQVNALGVDFGGGVGPGTGIGAADVAAAAENAAMGLDPGEAAAAAMGLGINGGNQDTAAGPAATGHGTDGTMGPGHSMSEQDMQAQMSDMSQSDNDTGGGGGGDSKVICTELHRQGYIPEHIWEADQAYVQTVCPEVRAGYLLWGVPWVKVMQRSRIATLFTLLLAAPWARHMAYTMGAIEKDDLFGRALNLIGQPLCRILWRCKKFAKQAYQC